jgi:hypothetical protein
MPVVAIAGAALAWVGAGAAVGAAIGGTLTVLGALEIIGAVGATLGAIGMITKNKGLMTAGLIMGAVGGIGALAVSAGVFGANAGSAAIFGSSAASSAAATTGAAGTAADAVYGMGGALEGIPGGAATDAAFAAGTAAGSVAPDIVDMATMIENQIPGGAFAAAAAPSAATISAPAISDVTGAVSTAAPTFVPPPVTPADFGADALGPGGLPATSPGAATLNPSGGIFSAPKTWTPGAEGFPIPGQQPGLFSGLMKNPYVQYGMIQSAGGLIQGLFDPVKPSQVALMNSQAEANRAAITLSLRQQANMQAPIPVASRVRAPDITGVPAPTGLINAVPPTVTGVPA